MSRESALFSADGLPVDLIRPGQPRLRRSSRLSAAPVEVQATRARTPLLRRLSSALSS